MQQGSISDLRDRLQERIASMRQKRHAPGTENAKARSRQDVLAARLKKKEDRKKALKAQKEKGGKAASEELVKDPTYSKPSAPGRPSADSIKMDGDLYFGKLDVGNEQKKKKGPSDAKTQLKKIETKQEKLQKLKAEDKDKAAALEEKEDWQKAIAMAQGEKFKDDVKLLKKTIKREEKQKSKSAEKWNERLDKVKRDEQYKVKKRNENLQKHIDFKTSKHKGGKKDGKGGKKDNKGGKGGKGGKARPGFEGGKRSKDGKVTKGKK
ncbi:surfeit locus protein 6-domain-containing protein [Phycomyces nitens]|nr:surfeit locus protein 6-domain-containing protein [Phycomyces nitens]